ncbi:hypothetical protein [Oribacterium sp. WCC10]|uniref:hypothetical protein n=1 Tax=Oribacterium sp. WCC10 TaxID=1855343 RepID=UPI0008F208AD|nr:hypothetical protein [Oribacterium sp. WCC10]SFG21469.1 hypothetical protein SAMN05216356_103184 [Oribacterium sp. WCC10]
MEFQEYAEHYFDMEKAVPYFLICFAALLVVMGIILIIARLRKELDKTGSEGEYIDESEMDTYDREDFRDNGISTQNDESLIDERPNHSIRRRSRSRQRLLHRKIDIRPFAFIESFYEMAFASTAVLLLLSLYYIINDRINLREVHILWDTYKDWILVAFLIVSMILNRIFDRLLVRLRYIDAKQRSSIRLVSSIYVILILVYICFIYQSPNYGSIIIYFVMMVIGRLFYFDVTWENFKGDIINIWKNLPILFLMIAYSGFTIWYGFNSQFLWKSNGVLVSTLIAHVFMDVGIVLIHHLRLVKLILR